MSGGHLSDHGPAAGSSDATSHHGPAATPDKKLDDVHVSTTKPTSTPDDKGKSNGATVAPSRTEASAKCGGGICMATSVANGAPVNVHVSMPNRVEASDTKPTPAWAWLIPALLGALLVLLGLMAACWTGAFSGARGNDTGSAPRVREAADPVKEFGALGPVDKTKPDKDKGSEAKPAAPAADDGLELIVDSLATRSGELQSALQLNREEDQGTLALAQETAKQVEAVTGRVDQLEARAAQPAPSSAPIGANASNPQGWSDVEMGIARRLISRLREVGYYDMNPGHEKLRAEAFGHAQQEEANWQRQSRRPVPSRGELDRVFPVGSR